MHIGFGNDFLNSGHDDLLCTPAQEFYLPNSNNWVPACQLKVGDVLKSDSVGSVAIMRIEFVNQPLTVYTLEVSKYHNFFVGKYFVLTHNMALPWEVTLGFSIPFGSACTGGRLGGFFGPVGIVGGAVIGGLVGLLAEKIINKDKVQEYVAYFDTELVGGWIKANDGRKRSLGPTQGGGSQLPNDPNNKKEPDWTPHQYKHFPKKNTIWKDTIKSTRSPNAAKYKPDINIKELEYQAWKEGTSVHGKSFKVFKADKVIGASTGTETYCMKVKISSNVIHGHPITLAEYLNCIK
ncbi:hypothetical protein K2X40_02040 [Candidatus Babeliales bacterium]|nr:hypothetical protein [Candidatus Babeliales bacterium]